MLWLKVKKLKLSYKMVEFIKKFTEFNIRKSIEINKNKNIICLIDTQIKVYNKIDY